MTRHLGFKKATARAVGAFVLPLPAAGLAGILMGWASESPISPGSLLSLVIGGALVLGALRLMSGLGSPKRVLMWFSGLMAVGWLLAGAASLTARNAGGWTALLPMLGVVPSIGVGVWAAWRVIKLPLPEVVESSSAVDADVPVLNYAEQEAVDVVDIVRITVAVWAGMKLLIIGMAMILEWRRLTPATGTPRGDWIVWCLWLGAVSAYVAALVFALRLRWARHARHWVIRSLVTATLLAVATNMVGYWDQYDGRQRASILISGIGWELPFMLLIGMLPRSRYDLDGD